MPPKAKRQASNPPKAKAAARTPSTGPAKAASPTRVAKAAPAAKAPAKAAGKALAKAAPEEKVDPEEEKRAAEAAAAAAEEVAKEAEKKAAEEAEAAKEAEKKAAEEAEAEKQKAEIEAELKRLAELANGEVVIRYSMYAEKFPISDHKLTAATIDELYCLTDVMPGCFIHLAEKEFEHGEDHHYMKEDPPGTFHGLMANETYWCYVQQDPEQEKKDQERMRQQWAGVQVGGGVGDRGSEGETCSCGWGAPCTNPMICKDWDNRFANAIKAGGNPILFTG
mmetsp:Transcript_124182/g.359127  ORF Transcript_124182/g.359127 Transcript_124182/m.359127 type:complete len:280 (+) Transcript_124182:105-944(+)